MSSVVNFGAFVDLGGMDGLVHVSELSWKHVDHPSSVVQVGDEIEVQVLEVDLDRERISLSLKATQQDPWQEFAASHRVGELVYGRVTKLVPFGAFVQVGDGIEGLVHISEMAAHHVDLPEQVVTPGEELWVKIIDIDLQRRRISLSIKQAAEGGEVAAEYQEAFGEHAYDERATTSATTTGDRVHPENESQAAWAAELSALSRSRSKSKLPLLPVVVVALRDCSRSWSRPRCRRQPRGSRRGAPHGQGRRERPCRGGRRRRKVRRAPPRSQWTKWSRTRSHRQATKLAGGAGRCRLAHRRPSRRGI